MKISTEHGSIVWLNGYDDRAAIKMIKDAGFDAFDYTIHAYMHYDYQNKKVIYKDHPINKENWEQYFIELRKYIDELDITCNQVHTPFPNYDKEMRTLQIKSLKIASILGASVAVVHPDNFASVSSNADFYKSLLPYAKEFGVKIACENMWDWDKENDQACKSACSHHEEFLETINAVNDPFLGACVDIGHAEMKGLNTSAYTMLKYLDKHVIAIHLHDTDRHHDNHTLPFSMNIDMNEVAKALKEINYQGDITLEACYYLKADMDLFEGVCKLADAAKRFRNLVCN